MEAWLNTCLAKLVIVSCCSERNACNSRQVLASDARQEMVSKALATGPPGPRARPTKLSGRQLKEQGGRNTKFPLLIREELSGTLFSRRLCAASHVRRPGVLSSNMGFFIQAVWIICATNLKQAMSRVLSQALSINTSSPRQVMSKSSSCSNARTS